MCVLDLSTEPAEVSEQLHVNCTMMCGTYSLHKEGQKWEYMNVGRRAKFFAGPRIYMLL